MMTSISDPDPLAAALAHKALQGCAGAASDRVVAEGEGLQVADIVGTGGPRDRPFEECSSGVSIALVLAGTFHYRGDHGAPLLSPGALLLVNAGRPFECSHAHGEGDRCLAFKFHPALFERLAHDAGAARFAFDRHRLPPQRALARATAQAMTTTPERAEEIACALAGTVVRATGEARREPPGGDHPRIARALSAMGARLDARHTLADLARDAGLSLYHFLRSFKVA